MLLKYARGFAEAFDVRLLAPVRSLALDRAGRNVASNRIRDLLESGRRFSLYGRRLCAGVRPALNSGRLQNPRPHSSAILCSGHGFEMRGPDASRIRAQVVDSQSLGDVPDSQLIRKTMSADQPRRTVLEPPVPVSIEITRPHPTSPEIRAFCRGGAILVDAFPKAVGERFKWSWCRLTKRAISLQSHAVHGAKAMRRVVINQSSASNYRARAACRWPLTSWLKRCRPSAASLLPTLIMPDAPRALTGGSFASINGTFHSSHYLMLEAPHG